MRLIFDIMTYTTEQQIDALLAQIDFEKAFDSIEWPFLINTLKSFNFGEEFITWITLLYTDIKSCVGNNGYYSNYFKLSRSIRQGCPISALLFILVAEIMAINIRSNPDIKGITINGLEYKISLMADDTTLFLKNFESLEIAVIQFNMFSKCSGLNLNINKTEIVPLGTLNRNELIVSKTMQGININTGPFKALGVWFSKHENEVSDLNFNERIKNIQQLTNIWTSRSLSLKGKITVIRSLILPQIQFLFSMIYVPDNILSKLDELLFKFLWNNKPPKVKRNTIIAPIEDGGLGMVDVFEVHSTAKCGWIRRLMSETDAKWKNTMWIMLDIEPNILNKNVEISFLKAKTQFYQQILDVWYKIHNIKPQTYMEIMNQYICYNQFIKINNKHICDKNLTQINIKIKDVIHENGKIKSCQEMNNHHNTTIIPMRWNSIVSSIPKEWKNKLIKSGNFESKDSIDVKGIYIQINNKLKKIEKISSKEIYLSLIKRKILPPTSIEKWIDIFPFMETFEWNKIFQLPFKVIREPYLQSFQYKILNRIINCRDKLFLWKIVPSNKCLYCDRVDSLEHHFFDCVECERFWKGVTIWIKGNLETSMNLTICEILFGIPIQDEGIKPINFIILMGKWFINKRRTHEKSLNLNAFFTILKNKINMIVYNKTVNNEDADEWEINLMTML